MTFKAAKGLNSKYLIDSLLSSKKVEWFDLNEFSEVANNEV